MVAFGDLAVISRPGAPSRQPETAGAMRTLVDLGYDTATIEPPATLDGGDVLKVGNTVYVGLGGRTNAAGVAQLGAHLEPRGAIVVSVPCTKVLHLKSAVTALPDGTIVGWPPAVDDPGVFPTFLATPEESGAHVVLLGDERLADGRRLPEVGGVVPVAGLSPRPRRHQRVPEAGRLCDLPQRATTRLMVSASRAATTRPALQPGARPPGGGAMRERSTPLLARSHDTTEFEFHISPAPSSSLPHTGAGTSVT